MLLWLSLLGPSALEDEHCCKQLGFSFVKVVIRIKCHNYYLNFLLLYQSDVVKCLYMLYHSPNSRNNPYKRLQRGKEYQLSLWDDGERIFSKVLNFQKHGVLYSPSVHIKKMCLVVNLQVASPKKWISPRLHESWESGSPQNSSHWSKYWKHSFEEFVSRFRENASKEQVLDSYRTLMRYNHPDLGGFNILRSTIIFLVF